MDGSLPSPEGTRTGPPAASVRLPADITGVERPTDRVTERPADALLWRVHGAHHEVVCYVISADAWCWTVRRAATPRTTWSLPNATPTARALLKAHGVAHGVVQQAVNTRVFGAQQWIPNGKQRTNSYLNDSWKNLCALELARLPQLLSPDPHFFVCLNGDGDPRFFCADLPGHSEPKDWVGVGVVRQPEDPVMALLILACACT